MTNELVVTMYRTLMTRLLLAALLAIAACGGDETPANNATPDATADVGTDSSLADAGSDSSLADVSDTSADAAEAGDADAADSTDSGSDSGEQVPLDGFGAISGPCGVLDDELTSTDSYYIENHIDFGTDPYDEADESLLTDGSRELLGDGNAGGSSLMSEVFAYEVLHRCELAAFLKSETEVSYTTSDTSITDLLVEIDGLKIGVSVTRAYGYPPEDPYTVEQASQLLTKKLEGIQESSANVAPEDAWTKQILHVLAYEQRDADTIESAYNQLDASLRADTVVFVTISDGDDEFIY